MASGSIMSLLDSTYESKVIPCNYCFCNLFKSQMRLKSTPQLPATTLKRNCYNSMFAYCTGLTAPPTLPATTLATECYNSMLKGCTGITGKLVLPATTLAAYCYKQMFYGCTRFNEIDVAFTEWGDGTNEWLNNVSSVGTFRKPAELYQQFGNDWIPSGWTVVNK